VIKIVNDESTKSHPFLFPFAVIVLALFLLGVVSYAKMIDKPIPSYDPGLHVCDKWVDMQMSLGKEDIEAVRDCNFETGWYYSVCKVCEEWHNKSDVCPGCIGSNWTEECGRECVCDEWEQEPCASEMKFFIPGDVEKYDYTIDRNVLCYDFEDDPDNLTGIIQELMELYPDDWSRRVPAHELDPVITYIPLENGTEPYHEVVLNWTKENKDACKFVRSR
jgi:hypothetical protein